MQWAGVTRQYYLSQQDENPCQHSPTTVDSPAPCLNQTATNLIPPALGAPSRTMRLSAIPIFPQTVEVKLQRLSIRKIP